MANSDAPADGGVFISYRRAETAYAAGWPFNSLADRDAAFVDALLLPRCGDSAIQSVRD